MKSLDHLATMKSGRLIWQSILDIMFPATNVHKQYGVFFKSQKYLIIFNLISFRLYQGLLWGPSNLEADDIPMYYRASLPPNIY